MQNAQLLELLGRSYRRLARRLASVFQAEGLSKEELIVLWRINKKGSCRATEVACWSGIPPSTFTGIFDRLVARGLLERVLDLTDRRVVLVQGTLALKELLERLTTAIEREMESIFSSLPDEDDFRPRLMEDLQLFHQYLDQEEGEDCERA